MKRYNRWFNLITSIVIDVVGSLFLIFTSLPSYTDFYYWDSSYRYYTYSLVEDGNGYTIMGLVFMYVFLVFATASLIIDILHAAGPFKERKAYRFLHLLFSGFCFASATTAIPMLGISLGYHHWRIYDTTKVAFICVVVLCAIEIARIVLGIIACFKAKNQDVAIGTSITRDIRYNSDYAVKKLKDLKDLLSAGIISEEEYNEAKKKYVKDL